VRGNVARRIGQVFMGRPVIACLAGLTTFGWTFANLASGYWPVGELIVLAALYPVSRESTTAYGKIPRIRSGQFFREQPGVVCRQRGVVRGPALTGPILAAAVPISGILGLRYRVRASQCRSARDGVASGRTSYDVRGTKSARDADACFPPGIVNIIPITVAIPKTCGASM